MGNTEAKAVNSVALATQEPIKVAEGQAKPKCKACCACPETRKARDACILERGEADCGDLIEKHKQCLRDMGFKA